MMDTLEHVAHRVASLLWDRGLAASVAVVVVSIVWFVLHRRLSAASGVLLYLGALSPLVFPVEWLLPDSLHRITPQAPVRKVFDVVARDPFLLTGPRMHGKVPATGAIGVAPGPTSSRDSRRSGFCFVVVGFCVWLALVTGWLIHCLMAHVRTARAVRAGSDLADHPLGALVARLAPRMGITRSVRVVRTAAVSSPATCGLVRPVILLPANLLLTLTFRQLAWVLQHELAHIRRGDAAVAMVQRLVQILYCFHPVVWLAGRIIDQLREFACDDQAIASGTRTRKHCAEGFIRVIEQAAIGHPAAPPGMALFRDSTVLRRRLQRMLDERRTMRLGVSRPAATGITAVLCLALPAVSSTPHGSAATVPVTRSIERGLDWLALIQCSDGRWRAGEFAGENGPDDRNALNDAGVTGLAVLALLGDGRDDSATRSAAARGVRWLLAAQDPLTGQIAPAPSVTQVYNHGYATLALARARRAATDPAVRAGLQAAVDHTIRQQTRSGGWGYLPDTVGPCDSSISGLILLSLCTARVAGADVPEESLARGVAFLQALTDPVTGRTGYNRLKGRTAQAGSGADENETLTALSLIVRVHLGEAQVPALIRLGATRVIEHPPLWQARAIDFYYWFCGTTALSMDGGAAFKEWTRKLADAVLPQQRSDGSWPAADRWSNLGGDVYATAMCVLGLQESAAGGR